MGWLKKPPAPVEPQLTPEDYLALADTALRSAEVEFAESHLAVINFLVKHPEHLPAKRVGDDIFLTLKPGDPEYRALLSRENRAIQNRNQAMVRRVEVRKRYVPESVHVAGVKVSP